MQFTDTTGKLRNVVGVIGALEVVDEGAGGVLPHHMSMGTYIRHRLVGHRYGGIGVLEI